MKKVKVEMRLGRRVETSLPIFNAVTADHGNRFSFGLTRSIRLDLHSSYQLQIAPNPLWCAISCIWRGQKKDDFFYLKDENLFRGLNLKSDLTEFRHATSVEVSERFG